MARLAKGLVELHAPCLKILAEGIQALNLKADVIQRPPLGGRTWLPVGGPPYEYYARNVADQIRAKLPWYGAKHFNVPVPHLLPDCHGDVDMHMVALNRNVRGQ